MNDIEIDSVTKRFEDMVAVDNISMSVAKGELFGLLGPNGAGKSTLTKMISGILNSTSGTIKVGNYSIQNESMKVKEILGVVPQDIVLYDYLNAKENLAFYGRLYGLSGRKLKNRIEELLKFTKLVDAMKDIITRNLPFVAIMPEILYLTASGLILYS